MWTKPILPIVNGSYSYAVAFLSNRVDGYQYKIDFELSELGLNHTAGYLIEVIRKCVICIVMQTNQNIVHCLLNPIEHNNILEKISVP